ncbi:MAG: radical SAM protein [Thermoanaerobaculia bacterium]
MTLLVPAPAPAPAREQDEAPPLPRVDPVTRLPILILFPHNRCNCRCLMCDIWKERAPMEISAAHVAPWLAEWKELGVLRIVLTGGEALMHSHLWPLCDLFRGAGIGLTLLSSGLLLARDAASIVKVIDDVVVSLDGPRDVHDAIRNVPRAFDRLVEGVAAIRAAGPGVSITARCTVQRRNATRLCDTVTAAREAGLQRISFLAVDVSSEAFNRPDGIGQESPDSLALPESELPALEAELARLEHVHAHDFASGFIAESPGKLRRRLLDYFRAIALGSDFPPNECNAPWVSSVIESDGTVRPCFFQPALGNIHRAGGLADVLNSETARTFRRNLDVATDPICRRCVCTLNLREPAP